MNNQFIIILQLLQKIKNNHGAALQNIRSAVWRVFGHERLPPLKSNAAAADIVRWKESPQVSDCYRALFQQNNNGIYWVSVITRTAFSTAAVPILTNEHSAFALSVCDILLNPRSRNILCMEKRMKRRIEQFLVSYWNLFYF